MGLPAAHLQEQATGRLGEVMGVGVGRCRTDGGDRVAGEQRGIGKRQVVVQDEPGRHQHDPAAVQVVERPHRSDGDRQPGHAGGGPDGRVARGQQQRTGHHAGHGQRPGNGAEGQHHRAGGPQQEPLLVAVRGAVDTGVGDRRPVGEHAEHEGTDQADHDEGRVVDGGRRPHRERRRRRAADADGGQRDRAGDQRRQQAQPPEHPHGHREKCAAVEVVEPVGQRRPQRHGLHQPDGAQHPHGDRVTAFPDRTCHGDTLGPAPGSPGRRGGRR